MIDLILMISVTLVSIPVIYLVVQLISAKTRLPDFPADKKIDLSRIVVIVPAHDEESAIEATLTSLISELPSSRQVLVVADNCNDDTVKIAFKCGVEVIERRHDTDRGKGFALEYGVQHLCNRPNYPEHVIFIDADCFVRQGSLHALIEQCINSGRPVQALYIMKSKGVPSPRQKVADFAWVVKNWVRPLGLLNLGLPCQLMGTGLAIPFELLRKLRLGSANIVEDMKLGLDCAKIGSPPVFCPTALIVSYFPEEEANVKSQRARWEHGHLGMIFSEAFGTLKFALSRRDRNSLAMALDLMIPPLAFLVLILSAITVFAVAVFWLSETGLIVLTLLAILSLSLAGGMILSWHRFGRKIISFRELLWLPVYVIGKLPLYARYWIRRETEWIRTGRDKKG
jgi:cellulose synthase/poly-beta-1,6-N-acetylglucosamine synthase-like glycosyltransferase